MSEPSSVVGMPIYGKLNRERKVPLSDGTEKEAHEAMNSLYWKPASSVQGPNTKV
jgi:hypothetical protein